MERAKFVMLSKVRLFLFAMLGPDRHGMPVYALPPVDPLVHAAPPRTARPE